MARRLSHQVLQWLTEPKNLGDVSTLLGINQLGTARPNPLTHTRLGCNEGVSVR